MPTHRHDVLILRDFREAPNKCSLMPLKGLPGIRIVPYHHERRVDGSGHILLNHEAEPLSPEDAGSPLLLADSSWRRLPKLLRMIDGEPVRRSLPRLVTAYPRESRYTPNPPAGLASVEALYAALAVMGEVRPELLDAYHWREEFLELNPWLAELVASR